MKNDILRQLAVIVTTIFALVSNGLANALPLNGRNTGEISDSFNVLFVPAGYVFSIWGVIYIGLILYTIYHSLPAQRTNPLLRRTGWLASLSSILNGAWIYLWHYGYYTLTLFVMLALLATLIALYLRVGVGRKALGTAEKVVVALPFSIYLGWITVATIANATALFSYLGFTGGGISPLAWTIILLIAGVIIAGIMSYTRGDVAYQLVLVWAFAGISVRWMDDPILGIAGFAAAGLVFVILLLGRLPQLRRKLA